MNTKERFRITGDVKVALDELFAKHENRVREEQLVDAAKPVSSPLHDLFPWDDKAAAHELRKTIAARILRSYHIVRFRIESSGKRERVAIPYAVKVAPEPEAEKVWMQTKEMLGNEYAKSQLIAERIEWVRRAIKQLCVIPELVPLYDELDAVIARYDVTGQSSDDAVA